MNPWIVWKPFPAGSLQGSMNAWTRSSWYGCVAITAMTDTNPAAPIARRCRRLAPATKNIVNAVRPMTEAVPRSGSRRMSATIGTVMTRNVSVPRQKPWTEAPRRASQWAR